MAFYDYICRNEECDHLKENEYAHTAEKMCAMKDRNDLPVCPHCNTEMPRDFNTGCPAIRWKYFSANKVWKTTSLGPAQREERRLLKYRNGQPIWRPIYKDSAKKKEKERKWKPKV